MNKIFPTGMRAIDLSHTIAPDMPYFPGTEPPVFSRPFTLTTHGFAEQRITLLTHTGTHMDAPAHILDAGATLEQLGLPHFIGSAVILDLTSLPAKVITVDDLQPFQQLLVGLNYIILHMGWSKHWGNAAYFRDYPVLSEAAAQWLAAFNFMGIGVDTISFDAHDSTALPIHRILLAKNIVLVENLVNLKKIPAGEFIFCCLPLKIAETDGSPVRAVALCVDSDNKR